MSAVRGTLAPEGAAPTREFRQAVTVSSPMTADKKSADSEAAESAGDALELVAGQVLQRRYAPRRGSLAALPGDLPEMFMTAAVPTVIAALAMGWFQGVGAFGAVSGLVVWTALASCGWWLGFVTVERVAERIEGRWIEGRGVRLRQAFAANRAGLVTYLGTFAAFYLLGGAVLLSMFGGPSQGTYIGLALALYVGAPAFLLAPWMAARAQIRARFGGEEPSAATHQGIWYTLLAPLTVIPNYLSEIAARSQAGLGWVRRVPSQGSLDLLSIASPLVHAVLVGAAVMAAGETFFTALPLFVGLGSLHVQHELAVLAETGAGVEARDKGHLKELLEGCR